MSQRDHEHMRQRLAQKTAQILLDSGTRDFHAAKHKAAQQLGATNSKNLPSNHEIEEALIEYKRIFHSDTQPEQLYHLRTIAAEAMRFLAPFKPRLVGSVLSGSAGLNSVIELHIFADTVESVGFYLADKKIPHELSHRRLKTGMDQYDNYSTFEFIVDGVPVELVVFLPKQQQRSLSPVDAKVIQRADLNTLEKLL
ncbi:MAG: hypothetical protein KAJ39_04410 [Gammaproteobacteria bacterium]|nr:hypothetical protein [Gammaproteobacteria bacterium]